MKRLMWWPAGFVLLALLPSCTRVALEGGDKPIRVAITHDVNIRVDRELEDFFAFQRQLPPATQPTTQELAR